MGYRRPRKAAADAVSWRSFRFRCQQLFETAELPSLVADDRRLFDDFLMHGVAGDRYTVEKLTPNQRGALKALVTEFLKSGFPDPGLSLFSQREDDELRIAAGLQPSSLWPQRASD